MKKRILSLALCAIMLLPLLLTGCSDSSAANGDETASSTTSSSSKAMTLTLYTITDSSTTEEGLKAVEDAINLITESDFNTHIILRAATEAKYEKLINDSIEAIEEQILKAEEEKAAKKAAEKAAKEATKNKDKNAAKEEETTTAESTTEADETVINEYGLEETVYPEEDGTQMDILLINSFDLFRELQAGGYLSALDEQLSIGSKILKQYIHPNFLTAAKVGSKTYAIPNNHAFGDYEYLLINKKVFDGLYYDIDNISKFNDLEDYFNDILEYEKNVIPLLGEYDGGIYYIDGQESLYGAVIPSDLSTTVAAAPGNLLTNSAYMTYTNIMSTLKEANGIVTDGSLDDGKTYGAAVIKGDYNTPALYEDEYYVLTTKYPTATNDNMYSGMYAVSSFTKDVARCMDIITYLSTSEEFINLMTYGVEDVHYVMEKIQEEGAEESVKMVKKISKDYSMNMLYTGNQFLMYQNTDMNETELAMSANKWELAKYQNLDMVISPYLGFQLQTTAVKKDKESGTEKKVDILLVDKDEKEWTIEEALNDIAKKSADYLKQIEEFEPYIEEVTKKKTVLVDGKKVKREVIEEVEVTLDDFMSDIKKEFAGEKALSVLTSADDTNSPTAQYNAWFASAYPAAKK